MKIINDLFVRTTTKIILFEILVISIEKCICMYIVLYLIYLICLKTFSLRLFSINVIISIPDYFVIAVILFMSSVNSSIHYFVLYFIVYDCFSLESKMIPNKM